MKQFWLKLLLQLYPQAWRERYGAEYLALLKETDLRWHDYLDSLSGAVDAHLHPEWVDARRFPMKQKRAFQIAGNGALLSALLLIVGLLNSNRLQESAVEFLILLAPVTLLPMVVVLHRLYRTQMPRLSFITAVIGILSMGTFLSGSVIGIGAELSGTTLQPAPSALLAQLAIACIGIWIILVALLGWRTHKLPNGLPSMMATSGFGWSVMFLGIILNSQGHHDWVMRLSGFMGAGLALWIMTHFVWTIWFGIWAWQQPNKVTADV